MPMIRHVSESASSRAAGAMGRATPGGRRGGHHSALRKTLQACAGCEGCETRSPYYALLVGRRHSLDLEDVGFRFAAAKLSDLHHAQRGAAGRAPPLPFIDDRLPGGSEGAEQ